MLTKFSITLAPIFHFECYWEKNNICGDEHGSSCTQCGIHGSKPLLKAQMLHSSVLHLTQSPKELAFIGRC